MAPARLPIARASQTPFVSVSRFAVSFLHRIMLSTSTPLPTPSSVLWYFMAVALESRALSQMSTLEVSRVRGASCSFCHRSSASAIGFFLSLHWQEMIHLASVELRHPALCLFSFRHESSYLQRNAQRRLHAPTSLRAPLAASPPQTQHHATIDNS